jgi:DNA-binding MarR family transcriptional regulator
MSKTLLMELLHDLSALIKRKPNINDNTNLTHRTCRVLTMINSQGSMNQRTLAAKLNIRPQSLTDVIASLEKSSYITRVKDDTNNRANLITLTKKGEDEAIIAKKRIEIHSNEFFDSLSDEEITTFIKLLEKQYNLILLKINITLRRIRAK